MYTVLHLHIAFLYVFIYKSGNLGHSRVFSLLGINMSVDMTRPKLTSLYGEIEFDFPSAHCGMCFNLSEDGGQGVGGGGWRGQKRHLIYIIWLVGKSRVPAITWSF